MKKIEERIKTLYIDVQKGQCILNGDDISKECSYLELEFCNGEWSLTVSLNKRYSSATKVTMEEISK